MYNHFILLSACAGSLTEVKSGDDQGCTKFCLAGNRIYLNLNWLQNSMHIFKHKMANNELIFHLVLVVVNNRHVLLIQQHVSFEL